MNFETFKSRFDERDYRQRISYAETRIPKMCELGQMEDFILSLKYIREKVDARTASDICSSGLAQTPRPMLPSVASVLMSHFKEDCISFGFAVPFVILGRLTQHHVEGTFDQKTRDVVLNDKDFWRPLFFIAKYSYQDMLNILEHNTVPLETLCRFFIARPYYEPDFIAPLARFLGPQPEKMEDVLKLPWSNRDLSLLLKNIVNILAHAPSDRSLLKKSLEHVAFRISWNTTQDDDKEYAAVSMLLRGIPLPQNLTNSMTSLLLAKAHFRALSPVVFDVAEPETISSFLVEKDSRRHQIFYAYMRPARKPFFHRTPEGRASLRSFREKLLPYMEKVRMQDPKLFDDGVLKVLDEHRYSYSVEGFKVLARILGHDAKKKAIHKLFSTSYVASYKKSITALADSLPAADLVEITVPQNHKASTWWQGYAAKRTRKALKEVVRTSSRKAAAPVKKRMM